MKKAISLLVGAVVAQGFVTNAIAGSIDGTVYGKLNTGIVMTDDNGTEDTALKNMNSRLGFKGSTELEDGLSAIYKLEYNIAPDEKAADTGNSQIFKQRNAYVGLKSKEFGTIIAGYHDTPLKSIQGKIDVFNDMTNGDIKNIIKGENRVNDLVQYSSPKFSGVQLKAATQLKENGDGGENGTSLSATYKEGAIYAAIAMDDQMEDYDTIRLAFQYKGDGFTAGALYSTSEKSEGSADSKDGLVLSGTYMIDAFNLKAQYGMSDEKSEGRELLVLGADYKLGDKTKLFAYTSMLEDDAGTDTSTYSLGLQHSF